MKLAGRLKGKELNISQSNSRKLNDLAHEVYSRRVEALLLTERTAREAEKLRAARVIASSLEKGGPAHEALVLYGSARKQAALSTKAWEAVSKKANTAMGKASKRLISAANKTLEAGRLRLQAEAAESVPAAIADSMDEVARGILSFRDRGLRSLGLEEGGATRWSALKAARRAGKDRIEAAFSGAAHEIPAVEKVRDLSKAHIQILDRATGQSRVNGKAIFQDLKESYGANILSKFTKDNPRFLSLLGGGVKKGEDVAELQNQLRQFTRLGEASKSFETGAEWGAQFTSQWKSVTNWHPSLKRHVLKPASGKGKDAKKAVLLPVVPTAAGLVHWWNKRRMGTHPFAPGHGRREPSRSF